MDSAQAFLKRWTKRVGGVAVLAGVVLGLAVFLVPLPGDLNGPPSTVVTWKDDTTAHLFLSPDDKWRIHADLERVDARYIEALLALEDARFWWHPGVDPLAVVRAAWANLTTGRVVSGASTITMQLVRLNEPRPRTFRSKLIEAFRALQIEVFMSKRRILEAYLSRVPYGRNIEGLETASQLYFDKSTRHLSPAEIATLLAVPQDPNARYPSPQNADRLESARNDIARQLAENGALAVNGDAAVRSRATNFEQIRRRDAPVELHDVPDAIPHAATWLKLEHPGETRIQTSISKTTQRTVEKFTGRRRQRMVESDIHNVSVLVVDNNTGDIRAALGNFDFFDSEHGGQIPGFAIHRSTGSLLKPFLYAVAMERGIAAPSHLVSDVPTAFGHYSPQNYGGSYRGLVRLHQALEHSLNIPFVHLLRDVGIESFLRELGKLGQLEFRRPAVDVGLSIAVGGLELRPLGIGSLYTTLANHGVRRRVDFRPSPRGAEHHSAGKKALSEEAAWLTARTLKKRDRPDFPGRQRVTDVPSGIAWKTGTSARNRDAWSAGFTANYTAVVWFGNFDNSRSPALIGAEVAAPLLFDVLEAIEPSDSRVSTSKPDGLTEVKVCSFSGHLPNEACPETTEASLPEKNIPAERCPYHVQVRVDVKTGLAVPPGCKTPNEVTKKSFLQIPSHVRRWLGSRLGSLPSPPDPAPPCDPATSNEGPVIKKPVTDEQIVLMPGLPASEQKIAFEATVSAGSTELHWFVDGEFIGSKPASDRLWWAPKPGTHTIVATDNAGRSDSRQITVRSAGHPRPR